MALADIINTITDEAKAKAEEIKTKAEATVSEIKEKGEERLAEAEKDLEKSFETEKRNRIEAEKLKMKMKVRAEDLTAKRELLNNGLDEILKKMEKLSEKDYEALIKKLLAEIAGEVESGEITSAKGRSKETRSAAKDFSNLTLKKDEGKFKGGVIVKSGGAEIDATFEHLVHEIYRPQLELIMSKKVFG